MTEPIPEEFPNQDDDVAESWKKDKSGTIRRNGIRHVYRQGFPSDTPYKEAVLQAMKDAKDVYDGKVVSHSKEQTPEHEEAGEYLIVLLIVEKGRKDRTPKDPEEGEVTDDSR